MIRRSVARPRRRRDAENDAESQANHEFRISHLLHLLCLLFLFFFFFFTLRAASSRGARHDEPSDSQLLRCPTSHEEDAIRALRALDAFVSHAGWSCSPGRPRTVSSCGAMAPTLYVSPGALRLAGYLKPNADLPALARIVWTRGVTPSVLPAGPAVTAPLTIPAAELPSTSVLMLGNRSADPVGTKKKCLPGLKSDSFVDGCPHIGPAIL